MTHSSRLESCIVTQCKSISISSPCIRNKFEGDVFHNGENT